MGNGCILSNIFVRAMMTGPNIKYMLSEDEWHKPCFRINALASAQELCKGSSSRPIVRTDLLEIVSISGVVKVVGRFVVGERVLENKKTQFRW